MSNRISRIRSKSRFILKTHLYNLPDYPVAWAGGCSVLSEVVVREERPRATTRLNRLTSCSVVGFSVPFCQAVRVAAGTPTRVARRLAGVLARSMAPLMSRPSNVLPTSGSCSESLFTQLTQFVLSISKPISFKRFQYLAPIFRSPLRYAFRFCGHTPIASAIPFRLPKRSFLNAFNFSNTFFSESIDIVLFMCCIVL